jgi:hypothetical protein
MELDNYDIVLIDYLYRYEVINDNIEITYWELKNEIYKFNIIQGKRLKKIEMKTMQQKIKEFYKLFPKFDFKSICDNDNPIMYITYLSHMKEKLK